MKRQSQAEPLAREALGKAYDEHAPGVFRLLRRLGVPEALAPDALQDVFLVAWRRHEDFQGRSSTRTWLCGIALRVARDYRRERDRMQRERVETELPASDASPEARYEQSVALRRLDAMLTALSDALRECFVLVEVEQLSAPEVAELLQIPLNTVYSRVRLARAGILDLMKKGDARHG